MENRKQKAIRTALFAVGALALVLIGVFCVYAIWEKPPETAPAPAVQPTVAPVRATAEATMEPLPEGQAPDIARADGMYTMLLVGEDQITGNTDTIMLGRFDTRNHVIDFVSLPRDTLINVDWEVRKLNSVYAGSRNNGGTGIDALGMHVQWLTGIEPDCYAVASLDVFMDVIDTMGGVWFDVPIAMDFDDYAQNLFIHLQPGYQLLNGYQAMGLCRFRDEYITGDLGRIDMQHAFLEACADQFVSLGNIPNASKVIGLISEEVDTNLTAANIAWFLRQALACDSENIRFHTMPTQARLLQDYSYAVVELWDWLPMINEYLDPYETDIGAGNLNVVYCRDDAYAATRSLQGAWYFVPPPSPTPKPAPKSTPTPGPDAAPEPTQGPTVVEVIVTPEPAPEPTPEPAPEPTPAPMPEPTPEDAPETEEYLTPGS